MKIVLLVDGLGFGGAQRQLVNLAIELKKIGHTVDILRYYADDFYLPLLADSQIVPITVNAKNALDRIFKIRSKIRGMDPDVLISFMGVPNFLGAMSSLGKKSWKFIASERIASEALFVQRKPKFFRSVVASCVDAVVCNSKSAEALWERYYPGCKDKLCTIYNIVDVPQVDAAPINDGKTRFLVAARYEQEKNLFGVIEAIKTLTPNEQQKMELHWFGKANIGTDGESPQEKAEALLKTYDLDSCVFLHPATEQIHEEMAKADFVSLFSFMEGLPNAILEGMSLKKPIVMSKVSDYAVLVDEGNGFCCDPNSVEEIAAAIRSAIHTTPEQRQAMGEKSYQKIQEVCSREAVIGQWAQLIGAVRAGKSTK